MTEPCLVIGIDVGGTRVKAAVTDGRGAVLAESVTPTPPRPGAAVVELAGRVAREHLARLDAADRARVAGVGVVVPGIVADADGIAVHSANLGWRDLDLRTRLRAELADLGVVCAVGHDVRAGLLAEHRQGAARDVDDVLFVPVGTGIAGALLVGGRVLGDGFAGEIGHVVVRPDGPTCGCGARGCLETIAGARALGARFAQLLGRDEEPHGSVEVARLVAAGGEGEQVRAARDVWASAIEALAQVIAPVVAAVGTRRLLVGGGLARAGETLLAPLREALAARLAAGMQVEVAAAALGDRAGALGAAALASDAVARERGEPG